MPKQRTDVTKIILTTVGAAGLISVAILAPNALGVMQQLGFIPGKRQKEVFETARRRMVKQGLLKYENGFVRLTSKGKQRLRQVELKDYQIITPKHWDKKWRVLMFDVPEKRKKTRELIRITLQRIGFVHLQDSVWIYPYDCEELVMLLKADLKIGLDVLYLVVERFDGDKYFREHFKL